VGSLFDNLFIGIFFIMLIVTIGLTYLFSIRLTYIKLTVWWKLFIIAFFQVVLALGLFEYRAHEIRSYFSDWRIMAYDIVYIFIIISLLGAVILKILTAKPWLSLLKVWGLAALLQILAIPFSFISTIVFLLVTWRWINPGYFE
jgi:hypothetical protein